MVPFIIAATTVHIGVAVYYYYSASKVWLRLTSVLLLSTWTSPFVIITRRRVRPEQRARRRADTRGHRAHPATHVREPERAGDRHHRPVVDPGGGPPAEHHRSQSADVRPTDTAAGERQRGRRDFQERDWECCGDYDLQHPGRGCYRQERDWECCGGYDVQQPGPVPERTPLAGNALGLGPPRTRL